MRQELRERFIAHPGELGTAREEIIRSFLRAYLPRRFEISSGFVFDSAGRLSRQIDIIIADESICPRFEIPGGKRIYPCEAVLAIGQIRSTLTSESSLREAIENLASATLLDRSANGRAIDPQTREVLDPGRNHLDRIFSFLWISGDALLAETARDYLWTHLLETAPQGWPNLVLALDQYLITFCCDGGVCPNPYDARGLVLQRAHQDDELLLRFYNLLGQALATTRTSCFPYWSYLQQARQWNAEITHGLDDPPPLLSNITRG